MSKAFRFHGLGRTLPSYMIYDSELKSVSKYDETEDGSIVLIHCYEDNSEGQAQLVYLSLENALLKNYPVLNMSCDKWFDSNYEIALAKRGAEPIPAQVVFNKINNKMEGMRNESSRN
ncbi:hypothetical protein CEW46_29250 [Bacillus cereus]|nr:hypothetical protein CEW46_29250 [Bacillus cereus]